MGVVSVVSFVALFLFSAHAMRTTSCTSACSTSMRCKQVVWCLHVRVVEMGKGGWRVQHPSTLIVIVRHRRHVVQLTTSLVGAGFTARNSLLHSVAARKQIAVFVVLACPGCCQGVISNISRLDKGMQPRSASMCSVTSGRARTSESCPVHHELHAVCPTHVDGTLN